MAGKQFVFLEDHEAVMVPIWREVLTGVDWMRLRAHPVYYGMGVARGDGAAVITVPGFLGSDVYLTEMNLWLRRIGYRAYRSRIGRNAECPDLLIDRLMRTVDRACESTGRKVHLVGHSLGGLLARSIASIIPERIASVTTMGSPFRGVRGHPAVLFTSERVRKRIQARAHTRPIDKPAREACFTGSCKCAFARAAKAGVPPEIQAVAIYTKTDGIVDWEMCVTGDPDVDVEVRGTHCGLAWNPQVYGVTARDSRAADRRPLGGNRLWVVPSISSWL